MPGRPHMKPLARVALLSVALACAVSHAGDEAPAPLYSFADLYRLTVSAPPAAALAFAEPRVYRTRELQVSANPEMIDVLRAEVARAGDLDAVAAWLKSRNARYSIVSQTQAAEEIPLAFLPQLARMQPGELAVFATPLGASVVQLVYSEGAPLNFEQASALIENFLAGRKRLAVAQDEVKRLRETARIEYVAQFKQSTR